MTEQEEIVKLKAQVARLKKRLLSKIKYEKGYLKALSTTPQLVYHIEQKDKAALEGV